MIALLTIMILMASLNVASYNSRGLGADRIDYIQELANANDFVLIQEHWQVTDQLDIFQ